MRLEDVMHLLMENQINNTSDYFNYEVEVGDDNLNLVAVEVDHAARKIWLKVEIEQKEIADSRRSAVCENVEVSKDLTLVKVRG